MKRGMTGNCSDGPHGALGGGRQGVRWHDHRGGHQCAIRLNLNLGKPSRPAEVFVAAEMQSQRSLLAALSRLLAAASSEPLTAATLARGLSTLQAAAVRAGPGAPPPCLAWRQALLQPGRLSQTQRQAMRQFSTAAESA